MDTFQSFTPAALTFLSDLKANNDREWFAANKQVYESEVKAPANQFGEAMSEALGDLVGEPHGHKLFRVYRDVRFSKDKTPYNPHIHLSFAPVDATASAPMWFFGLDPSSLSLGCGVFGFDKSGLESFRDAMQGPKGRELIDLTADLRGQGIRIGEPEMKRVPAGYDKDHPHAEALRRKGFSCWIDVEEIGFATEPKLVERTIEAMRPLLPAQRFLSALL